MNGTNNEEKIFDIEQYREPAERATDHTTPQEPEETLRQMAYHLYMALQLIRRLRH